MKFKLIVVMCEDKLTETAIKAARKEGATGSTVITSARGEGLVPTSSFLGLKVSAQSDIILFLVEHHRSRQILEAVGNACRFDIEEGTGVAFQVDIEDAIGLGGQIATIEKAFNEEDL
jgi:hypothetical protein